MDGTPASYEVRLVSPDSDGSGEYGNTKFSLNELQDIIARFDRQGIGLFMHSVGDGTTRLILDAIETVRKERGDSGVRHRIAHLVWVHPDDMSRFAAILGVTAEVSPNVGYSDSPIHSFKTLVGQERLERMFPVRSLVRAGARPGYGSDWLTLLGPSPWPTVQAFVTRMNPQQPELDELGKNETATVEEAIRIFTLNGAYTVMAEDRIGGMLRPDPFPSSCRIRFDPAANANGK